MKTLIFVLLLLCWLAGLSNATEAPGCGNQHYRPRLAQCCPKFLEGETLPPKCTHALADGFLQACCAGVPTPHATATPVATCPEGWACWPTPWPTVSDKGACCRGVLEEYRVQRRAIVAEKQAALKALRQWKQAEMQQCREAYGR